MATVTDPIILDSTGQDIVTALNNFNTPRDTAAYTTSFASSDTDDASATSWAVVSPIAGGETHATLFGKLSQIAKNVRYLYKTLGNTDLSAIADGTVSGILNNNFKMNDASLLFGGTKIHPTLTAPLTDYNGVKSWYCKVGNMVMIYLSIGGLTANTAVTAFTLPVGYRPLTPMMNKVCSASVNQMAECNIRVDGAVRIASTSTLCLGFVMFLAEQ
jgi:hypothetical protein